MHTHAVVAQAQTKLPFRNTPVKYLLLLLLLQQKPGQHKCCSDSTSLVAIKCSFLLCGTTRNKRHVHRNTHQNGEFLIKAHTDQQSQTDKYIQRTMANVTLVWKVKTCNVLCTAGRCISLCDLYGWFIDRWGASQKLNITLHMASIIHSHSTRQDDTLKVFIWWMSKKKPRIVDVVEFLRASPVRTHWGEEVFLTPNSGCTAPSTALLWLCVDSPSQK